MSAGLRGFGGNVAGRALRRMVLPALVFGMALALGVALTGPAQAQINPFGDHPGGLTAAERTAMTDAIGKVLDAGAAGATAHWQVGKVGGTAEAQKFYRRDDLDCALVTHRFDNTERSAYSLPFCKTADGWKIYF